MIFSIREFTLLPLALWLGPLSSRACVNPPSSMAGAGIEVHKN